MNPFTPLDRLEPADWPRAGGKAANCARLTQAGFPVPDALVVFADASDAAIAGVTSHPWFDRVPADRLFAVRSSGIGEDSSEASFAGVHETFLDVPRSGLAAAVSACRASARSARALAYREAAGLPVDSIAIGVLIQRMVRSAVSGVAFTVNPVTGLADEIVINAARGLGEALVSGSIDPDEYIVRKGSSELLLRRLGEGGRVSALSDAEIATLATLLQNVDAHYGAPQDVEWCRDEAGFWIVQSRPVTGVHSSEAPDLEWTRANFAEVFPDLMAPQALQVFEEMLLRAQRINVGGLAGPVSQLGPLVKSFAGRMYFNLTQMRHICRVSGTAPAEVLRSLGHAGVISAEDEVAKKPPLGVFLRALPDFARIASRHLVAGRIVRAHQARMAAYLANVKAVDPSRLTDAELWSRIQNWQDTAVDEMQTVLLLTGVTFLETPVRAVCNAVGFPFEQLVYPQLAVGERSVSSQQAFDLVALADAARRDPRVRTILTEIPPEDHARLLAALDGTPFRLELDRYLDNYGHRGVYESDWSLPRFHEEPTPILQALRAHVLDDSGRGETDESARGRKAADAWAAFTRRLAWWQRLVTLPRIRRSVATIKRYYVWRERVRSDMVRVLAVMRRWHLLLADRFVERGWLDKRDDYFFVHLPEIGAVIDGTAPPESLRRIVAMRRDEYERFRSLRMPLLMKERELPRLLRAADVSGFAAQDGGTLTGLPVSGGLIEAEVVVVRDPADFGRMTRGAILVAPATDPSWTPLFTLASGVIVEVGGVLSHASTIAREFGLPAIANVKHATRRLRTGERVRLDAYTGRIERLEAGAVNPV